MIAEYIEVELESEDLLKDVAGLESPIHNGGDGGLCIQYDMYKIQVAGFASVRWSQGGRPIDKNE